MRKNRTLVAIAVAALLAGCHHGGGGGGQPGSSPVHYGNTNPITHEQEHASGLPLRGHAIAALPPNEGIVSSKTTVITRGGTVLLHVDANKASAAQLQRVPGISEDTAAMIIRNRPYKNPDDLSRKTGLPRGRVASFSQYLTF